MNWLLAQTEYNRVWITIFAFLLIAVFLTALTELIKKVCLIIGEKVREEQSRRTSERHDDMLRMAKRHIQERQYNEYKAECMKILKGEEND